MSDPNKGLAQTLVQTGFDFIATKYYAAGAETLYFYDYCLTLEEEVQYIWKGKKTWLFYMFILNRYIPMLYAGWTNAANSMFYPKCDHTAILGLAFFVWATLVAQTFLIVRIYALTRGNRAIAMFFGILTAAQALLGISFIAESPNNSVLKVPDIKLDAYLICLFASNVQMESAYVSLSLGFDSCAFVVIVVSAFKTRPPSRENKFKLTGIVGTLVQDATIYFVMIFTSHLTLTMFIFSARETLKLIPASGNLLFLPMMVSRLILSLKKVAGPISVAEWRVDHFSRVEVTDTCGTDLRMVPVRKPSTRTASSGEPSTSPV